MLAKLPLLGAPREHPVALADLPWPEFERLLIAGFVAGGYQLVEHDRRASAIGGELLLRRSRETYLVHCKAWHDAKVETATLETLQRSMQARGVQGGFVLSFGRFSREATRYAAAQRIQLLDGPALTTLLEQARARARVPSDLEADTVPTPMVQRAVPDSPACPLCTKPMRLRTARRGRHAGHGFWACTNHPDCKGLLALA